MRGGQRCEAAVNERRDVGKQASDYCKLAARREGVERVVVIRRIVQREREGQSRGRRGGKGSRRQAGAGRCAGGIYEGPVRIVGGVVTVTAEGLTVVKRRDGVRSCQHSPKRRGRGYRRKREGAEGASH